MFSKLLNIHQRFSGVINVTFLVVYSPIDRVICLEECKVHNLGLMDEETYWWSGHCLESHDCTAAYRMQCHRHALSAIIEPVSNLVCKNTPGMFPTKTRKGRPASMPKKPIPKKKERDNIGGQIVRVSLVLDTAHTSQDGGRSSATMLSLEDPLDSAGKGEGKLRKNCR